MDESLLAQALRESEELHRVTLLSMSDAVFITNDDGAFTFICPNVDVIFGYGEDEVRAMERIARLLGDDLIDSGQLAASGEVRNIEREIQTKSGARRVLLVHVKRVSIRHGTIRYVCRDITERKEADYAYRRNEERLRLALEAAKAATWDWDVQTGDMSWSPDTHRLFGDATLERSPSLDSFLNWVHPLDRDAVASTVKDAMAGATAYETEFRVVGDDQLERWVLGKGKAFRNGKPLRMLGAFVDVSERHRAEEERRDLGGRLIDAHEQERRRLPRELHDGVGQRLALMSAEVARLREAVIETPPILEQVRRLSEHSKRSAPNCTGSLTSCIRRGSSSSGSSPRSAASAASCPTPAGSRSVSRSKRSRPCSRTKWPWPSTGSPRRRSTTSSSTAGP